LIRHYYVAITRHYFAMSHFFGLLIASLFTSRVRHKIFFCLSIRQLISAAYMLRLIFHRLMIRRQRCFSRAILSPCHAMPMSIFLRELSRYAQVSC